MQRLLQSKRQCHMLSGVLLVPDTVVANYSLPQVMVPAYSGIKVTNELVVGGRSLDGMVELGVKFGFVFISFPDAALLGQSSLAESRHIYVESGKHLANEGCASFRAATGILSFLFLFFLSPIFILSPPSSPPKSYGDSTMSRLGMLEAFSLQLHTGGRSKMVTFG
ncbi:unnamed protein product [Acanthosepion pharaonis]|uniref:Uncharacterized protein n=1 Tax=Acanthosepion pharaonis TaxID=158019 RepID=A0A812ALR1_ACAPH|nr:unnamed protein product [Sepia pharaonis]